MNNAAYELWLEKAVKDPDLTEELNQMRGNDDLISDAFYKSLEFGTAGLRGVIGAGTNRMNIYTVGQASQGLAAYVNSISQSGSIAIAYDSRNKSEEFAKTAASVFAANGIKVYIYSELVPTPMLSFAVRQLKCDAGVVITASHNPAKYNGYKAYAPDGSQLGPEAADYVLSIMNKVDIFDGVKYCDFDQAVCAGTIEYISQDIVDLYIKNVLAQRVEPDADLSSLNVVYTPLNGAGNKPVRRVLKEIGVKKLSVVPEQELPDGNFPTVPYPNPEMRDAFKYALKLAQTVKPDILLATDPDSDRVGIAVRDRGEYKLMTGNDVGVLLLDYILKRRTARGTLPKDPVAVKTIVTTELCSRIADFYGCELINVLTGFKFIGEQITLLAEKGQEDRYILGFEESYGYLVGSYARDKDAVVASMLICEMAAYYKSQNLVLTEVLENIYRKFGYYSSKQESFTFEGQSGIVKIRQIMESLRGRTYSDMSGFSLAQKNDYLLSVSENIHTGEKTPINLPKSDVFALHFSDGSSVIVRPSGTEPKIKLYLSAVGENAKAAEEKLQLLENMGTKLLGV